MEKKEEEVEEEEADLLETEEAEKVSHIQTETNICWRVFCRSFMQPCQACLDNFRRVIKLHPICRICSSFNKNTRIGEETTHLSFFSEFTIMIMVAKICSCKIHK